MKCNCLRYLTLIAGRKDESVYVFVDGDLLPIESVYPLEEFETGTGALICTCPWYNFIFNGRLITRAFERRLKGDEKDIIQKAVKNCEQVVPTNKHLILGERYKEIFKDFCSVFDLRMTFRLLKLFIKFLKVRREYKRDDLCKDVPPAERKRCFDELWRDSFKKFLEVKKFDVDRGN